MRKSRRFVAAARPTDSGSSASSSDDETVTVALRATCRTSDGRRVPWDELSDRGEERDGSDVELGRSWIDEDSTRDESAANLRCAVGVALGSALAPLLEPD